MAYCRECGTKLLENAKFCPNCGTRVNTTVENENIETERREIYDGEVHKCPYCGEILKAFEIECPSCHKQIRGSRGSTVIKKLSESLVNAPTDKQRIIIIKNFPIPNTKEDIFEFMMLASSNFDSSYYATHLHEDDMSDAWLIKIEQCYKKAKLLFEKDPDFAKIEEEYIKIKEECEDQENKIIYEKKAQESALQREESARDFKKSKFKIVLIIFEVISSFFIAFGFINNKIIAGIIACIMLLAFIISYLMGLNVIKEKARRIHIIPAIIGFLLIIPYFVFFSTPSKNPVKYGTINWEEIELKDYVPNLDKQGVVRENTTEELHIEFSGLTTAEHNQVLKDVKEIGYTNVKFTNSVYYNAYNAEEYYLEVWWHEYNGTMDFYLDAPIKMSTINWNDILLKDKIPEITSTKGVIEKNTQKEMNILVDDISYEQYQQFISDTKQMGYTIDIKETENSREYNYEVYHTDGTKIVIEYNECINNFKIIVTAPETYSEFVWPNTSIVNTLPKPKSNVGKIISNSDSHFWVKVANTTFTEFQTYVNECVEKGYDEDYHWWDDNYFNGKKGDYDLSVKYSGNNVMEINLYYWGK